MNHFISATRDLLRSSGTENDVEVVRQKFLNCYDELEPGNIPLAAVVEAAFDGLERSSSLISLFHRTAAEIARRVDLGEDGTAANDYHNVLHDCKVAINFRALAEIHNALHPEDRISDEKIAQGILDAVTHDVRHNGRGNTVEGVHQQFRLEQLAIDTAMEWAAPKNEEERDILLHALAPIYATDISSDGTHISPARFVRMLYDAGHGAFAESVITPYSDHLRRELSTREDVVVASLLQDADVLASLLEEKAHRREHGRVGMEIQKATGKPPAAASGLWFLDTMLQGRETTDAARRLADSFVVRQIERYRAELSPA